MARAALIERGYLLSLASVANCESIWSIAGIMVAILGVPQEKNNVASLKILGQRVRLLE
jgi:hypothetical protein